MVSSNARNERRFRKFSVHLTRLTAEDIVSIRCQLKRKAEEEASEDSKPKTKKKKSSNCRSVEATASSATCISKLAADDNRSQKPAKTKTRKKPTSSSSRSSKKKKSTAKNSSSNRTLRSVAPDNRFSTWDDHRSYSTSEESELEEVFVPRKIWIKPSARPLSPTSSKSDTSAESQTHEIQQGQYTTTRKFPIRQPVVLLKKIITDTKYEICDDAVPSTSSSQTSRTSNTSCCLQWSEAFQERSTRAITTSNGSHEEESKSDELTDGKLSLHLEADVQSLEDADKPILLAPCDLPSQTKSIAISEVTANSNIPENSPSQCSCQLASPKVIAVRTDKPEASTKSNLRLNELAEASTQNTVALQDTGAIEENQNDTIFSPVIFDEGSQASQEASCQVSSPIIFGSDEGTAAERADDPNEDQDATSDTSNVSSSFSLELSTNEPCEKEAPRKNCDLTSDASQNFNLQLSGNIHRQNAPSSVNSQESSGFNFALKIPGAVKDFAGNENPQLLSSDENMPSLKTNQRDSSGFEAACNVSETTNISRCENSDQFTKGGCHLSVLKDESLLKRFRVGSSAVHPKQHILVYSAKTSIAKRPSISVPKETLNFSGGEKSNSSRVENSDLFTRPRSPSSTTEVHHSVSGYSPSLGVSSMSKPKKTYLSSTKRSSFSKSEKSCPFASETAKVCQKSYLSPSERLLGTQKSNLSSIKGAKLPANCNDAFTQTDLQHQQPSQLSVNYIINSSSLDTIRFEGPVVNHPSTICEKIPTATSTFVADRLTCPEIFSSDFFRTNEVSNLPKSDSQLEKSSNALAQTTANVSACCGDSTLGSEKSIQQRCRDDQDFLASQIVIDSIDLTNDDELKCEESSLGKIRLKTPSELGCTIAFTDDVERLFRHELPKLRCNFDKLELLKNKHFNIFKYVVGKYYRGKQVDETLQELYSTRSVPCGSNLMRHSPTAGLDSLQMSVKSPTDSTGRTVPDGSSTGSSNRP